MAHLISPPLDNWQCQMFLACYSKTSAITYSHVASTPRGAILSQPPCLSNIAEAMRQILRPLTPASTTPTPHLHFRNLPAATTDEQLLALCLPYGPASVVSISQPSHPSRSPSRFATVSFDSPDDALHACVNLHLAQFFNNTIRVHFTSAPPIHHPRLAGTGVNHSS